MDRVDILENDLIRRKRAIAQRRHRLEDEQEELARQLEVSKKTAELESESKSTELDGSSVCSPLIRQMGITSYVRYIQQHKHDNDKYALSYNHSLGTPNDYLQHQLDKCVDCLIKYGRMVLP